MSEGFSAATSTLLDRAEALCVRRGARLTGLRRQVLGLILDSPAPTGAYELLDRLREARGPAAPPTVYRALDFLQAQGLVHRLERLSAFVGCVEAHGHEHDHPAQFLICGQCGRVTELDDHELSHTLAVAARRVGFHVKSATIEAEGLCADCAKSLGESADQLSIGVSPRPPHSVQDPS